MTTRLFIHGVPDTPAMWNPLLDALGSAAGEAHAPAMPGFTSPPPEGFDATMHAYADWLTEQVDRLHAESGPIDLVGHDWGALLTLRVAHIRREKIRSWTAINGAFDPLYRGHFFARLWARPRLEKLVLRIMTPALGRLVMRATGLPPDKAAEAAARISPDMARCITRLYRSADGLRDFGPWYAGLEALPRHGLIVWGDRDPFLPLDLAERVSALAGVPLHIERGAGHWLPKVRTAEVADVLRRHWRNAPPV